MGHTTLEYISPAVRIVHIPIIIKHWETKTKDTIFTVPTYKIWCTTNDTFNAQCRQSVWLENGILKYKHWYTGLQLETSNYFVFVDLSCMLIDFI